MIVIEIKIVEIIFELKYIVIVDVLNVCLGVGIGYNVIFKVKLG